MKRFSCSCLILALEVSHRLSSFVSPAFIGTFSQLLKAITTSGEAL